VPKVLIVDDHSFIRSGVRAILAPSPEWEICGEGADGSEAVRLADSLQPDIIVMDVSMPGTDGITAARAIHAAHPRIQIVLLTLHDSSELLRQAFRAGAQGYILKSDASDELLRALRIVVAGGTYMSPAIDSQVAQRILQELSSGPR